MSLQEQKNKNVILYFLNKSPEKSLDRLKLMKLLWLSDRYHLNKYGRKITKSEYFAMPRGPVASEILDLLNKNEDSIKRLGNNQIAIQETDTKFLSKTDMLIMDEVWNYFKDAHQFDLVNSSHEFPEWKRFENYLQDPNMPNSYVIVEEDFFEKNDFLNAVCDEIRESSKQEYLYNKSLTSALGL